jgi:hypothetical protein
MDTIRNFVLQVVSKLQFHAHVDYKLFQSLRTLGLIRILIYIVYILFTN